MNKKTKPREPPVPREASQTVRRSLIETLRQGFYYFEDLRREHGLSTDRLENHLDHIHRSLAQQPESLVVKAARCADCSFSFDERKSKRFSPPGRCPSCRSEYIVDPAFRIVAKE
jgi:transcriptional regulator